MIHIIWRSHEFHYQKVLYLWEICRGSNGNIQCKITRHFLKWSTKWKRSKTMGGSALWTGLVHVIFRVDCIKIVWRVNSGILHHSLYSKTWDWTPKQSTLLLIRAILILPKNRRQLNWIDNSRVKTTNFPQVWKGAGPGTHRTPRVARTRPLGESPSHPRGHFPPSLSLIKATLFANEYLLRDQLCIGQSTVTGLKMKTNFTVKNTYVHGLHTQASP